jgi:hypothetical protein
MGQVIKFPKDKINSPPQNFEEVMAAIENSRKDHIEAFLDTYMPILFQSAYNEGFDLTQDKCNEINSLFVESFRAALLQSVDLDHHLVEFAKDSIALYNQSCEEEKDT